MVFPLCPPKQNVSEGSTLRMSKSKIFQIVLILSILLFVVLRIEIKQNLIKLQNVLVLFQPLSNEIDVNKK